MSASELGVRRAVSSKALIGRDAELAALTSALGDIRESRPWLTLVTGEAGVGKTRVVREIARRAEDEGILTLLGECVELSGGEVPYGPLAAAIGELDPDVMAETVDALPAAGRRELARAFPGLPFGPDVPRAAAGELGQAELFGWLLRFLRRLSASSPLLLTIEDLHWADVSTRDFLLFLVQQARCERLGVLVTVRTSDLHAAHPAQVVMARLPSSDRVRQLDLRPLTMEHVELQVTGILGVAPPADLLRRVFDRGEGNPFYTEELLAGGLESDAELPTTLRDALLSRVRALSPPAQQMLRLLAAMSASVDAELIEAAAGFWRGTPRVVLEPGEALRECVDRQLVVYERRTGHFRFRHALLREAVYAELLPSERVELHRCVAEALERRGAGGTTAAERAYHWEAAGESAAAVSAAIEAALAAERVYAHGEALAQFERALRLSAEPLPVVPALARDRIALAARAAEAARWFGDYERAAALCREALGLFDHEDDPLRAAELFERLGRYHWKTADRLEALHEALRLLPEREVAQRMRTWADVALAYILVGRWSESRAAAEQALRDGGGSETEAEEGAARAALGFSIAFMGDTVAGEEQLSWAVALAEQAGSSRDVVQATAMLAEVLRLEGRIADALAVMVKGQLVADAMGATGSDSSFMAANASDDLFRLGRWDEAAERVRAFSDSPVLGVGGELILCSVTGRLQTARGEFVAAAASFERALVLARDVDPLQYVPAVRVGAAELELWNGRIDAARAHVSTGLSAVGVSAELLHTPPLYSMAVRLEAECAVRARLLGDTAAAGRACARAQEHAEALAGLVRSAWSGAPPPPEAEAHRASCRAELTRADGHAHPPAWADAAARWRAREAPYALAYALYRQAEALLARSGGRSAAQAALAEAERLCAALGAVPLRDEIVALARRARLKLTDPGTPSGGPTTTAEASSAKEFGLTARELEVLALLAAGLTNRQISQRLYISPHTAGVHVSHILGKLGVPNRVMAAAAAQRLGLVEPG